MDQNTLTNLMIIFIDTEIEPYIQESTYRTYLECLRASFFSHEISALSPERLTAEAVTSYIDDLLLRKSRNTVEMLHSLLKRFLSWLYKEDFIAQDFSPFVTLKKERRKNLNLQKCQEKSLRKRYFTPEDIRKIYYGFKRGVPGLSKQDMEWLPLILLQLETFLRVGEVLSIFLWNIDLENEVIWIRNTVAKRFRSDGKGERYIKVPKNGYERIVPLSPAAKEAVLYMIRTVAIFGVANPHQLLYPSFRNGNFRSTDNYERAFRKICDALSIDRDCSKTDCIGRKYGLNTHALRHTGITMANTAPGANLVNTALMAGHSIKRVGGSDIGAEASYIHAVRTELRKVKTPCMILGLGETDTKDELMQQEIQALFYKLQEREDLKELLEALVES